MRLYWHRNDRLWNRKNPQMVDLRICEKYVCDQEDMEIGEEKDELTNTSC